MSKKKKTGSVECEPIPAIAGSAWNDRQPDALNPASPCHNCPANVQGCTLQGTATTNLAYNLVFLFEMPDSQAIMRDEAESAKIKRTLRLLLDPLQRKMRSPLHYSLLYAVGAEYFKQPPSGVVSACRPYVVEKLSDLAVRSANVTSSWRRQNIIVAFGQGACESVGVDTTQYKKIRGTPTPTRIGGHEWTVIPTHSLRALAVSGGLAEEITGDIHTALTVAFDMWTPVSVEEITRGCLFPTTGDEILACAKMVLEYCTAQIPRERLPRVMDFETTSLRMYDPDARAISFAVAWGWRDTVQAASWFLDHREASMDPVERLKRWAATVNILVEAPRPVWHHHKFDITVCAKIRDMILASPAFLEGMRPYITQTCYEALRDNPDKALMRDPWWDTMLGEHWLNEDRDSYSLKSTIQLYAPDMAGYETQLHHKLLAIQRSLGRDDPWAFVEYEGLRDNAEARAIAGEAAEEIDALEDQYVKAVFLRSLSPKGSMERETHDKTATSLRGRIRTRYNRCDVEPPDSAKVDLKTAFDGCGTYEDLPGRDVLLPYGAVDVLATMRCLDGQWVRAKEQAGRDADDNVVLGRMRGVMEMLAPASTLLGRMSYEGIRIDTDLLEEYRRGCYALRDRCKHRLLDLLCREVNYNSRKQVEAALIECLGVDPATVVRSKDGLISTSEENLKAMAKDSGRPEVYLFVYLLLLLRASIKAADTYLHNMERFSILDGKVRPQALMTTTVTGRLSIIAPPLQTIPKVMCDLAFEMPAKMLSWVLTLGPDDKPLWVCNEKIGLERFTGKMTKQPPGWVFRPGVDHHGVWEQMGNDPHREPTRADYEMSLAGESSLFPTKVKLETNPGFAIKRLMVPPPGYLWWNADIASAEIRVLCAYLPKDSAMVKAMSGRMQLPEESRRRIADALGYTVDNPSTEAQAQRAKILKPLGSLNLPSFVTAAVFGDKYAKEYLGGLAGLSEEERLFAAYFFVQRVKDLSEYAAVGKDRDGCKRVLYGYVYGASIPAMALQMYGMLAPKFSDEYEEQVAYAQLIKDGIDKRFPEIAAFIAEQEAKVIRHKRVWSYMGRCRRFPTYSLDRYADGAMLRQSVNAPIQGDASDALLATADRVDRALRGLGSVTVMPMPKAAPHVPPETPAEPDAWYPYNDDVVEVPGSAQPYKRRDLDRVPAGAVSLLVHDAQSGIIRADLVGNLREVLDEWIVADIQRRFGWLDPIKYEYDVTAGATYRDQLPLSEVLTGKTADGKPLPDNVRDALMAQGVIWTSTEAQV